MLFGKYLADGRVHGISRLDVFLATPERKLGPILESETDHFERAKATVQVLATWKTDALLLCRTRYAFSPLSLGLGVRRAKCFMQSPGTSRCMFAGTM